MFSRTFLTVCKYLFIVIVITFFPFFTKPLFASEDSTTEVTIVSVWLKVLNDAGESVKGLTANDFEIFENEKKVEATCFEELDLAHPQAELSDVNNIAINSQTKTRKFTLFLDLYNISQSEFEFIRPRIKDFLGQIKGRNEIMVTALVPPGKLGVVAQFTSDLPKISNIIDHAKGNQSRDSNEKENESKITTLLQDVLPEDNPPDSVEDLARTDPRADLNNQLFNSAFQLAHTFTVDDIRRSELSVNALESFGKYLAAKTQNDHNNIIYISGGYTADPGRRYFDLINNFADKLGFNRDPLVFSLRFPKSKKVENFDMQKLIKKAIGGLNRLDITLYAVNTRGMVLSSDNTAQLQYLTMDLPKAIVDFQDPLIRIANETGGLSFSNSQNFKVGFDSILQDLQHQYTLCYRAPEHKKKDKYYEIKVVCKKPGVKLRYRKGYIQ